MRIALPAGLPRRELRSISLGAAGTRGRVRVSTHFLATPLGTFDPSSSSSIMSNLPKPSEVEADNIIKPNLEELSAEHRQAYEEYKKAHEEKEL